MGENDAGKVFVGGLPKGCSQEVLQNWASQFGAVSSVEIRCDQFGTPRGFGFVVFADPSSAEKVLQNHESNSIEGKWVDCKPIMAPGQIAAAKGGGKGANDPLNPPNKIFVGGLPKTATQESVTAFFSGFGALKEVLLKVHDDGQCKGYAFITFEELAPVEQLLQTYATNSFEGKWIDIKQAMTMPKGNDKGKGKGKGKRRSNDEEPDAGKLDDALDRYFGKDPPAREQKETTNGKKKGDADSTKLDAELDKYFGADKKEKAATDEKADVADSKAEETK